MANHFPGLGKYKRYTKALYDSCRSPKPSYSQHGEDAVIWDVLKAYDLRDSIYVDVGANHPSDISNSYLLYRNGLHGVIIEPNEELLGLFHKFRARDIPLMIGCSNVNTVLKFNISKTPVLSSFAKTRDVNTGRSQYVPVMKLDDAVQNIPFRFVSLLSIDVEGLSVEVLAGAPSTIAKSLLVCIEFDRPEEKQAFATLLGNDFELLRNEGCNLLFINNRLKKSLCGDSDPLHDAHYK